MEFNNEELFPFMYKFWAKQPNSEQTVIINEDIFENKVENDELDLFNNKEEEEEIAELEDALQELSQSTADKESDDEATYGGEIVSIVQVLDGKDLNDIPARYTVPTLQPYEFPACGVWIDRRIVPGFKYIVRPIDDEEFRDEYLFNGEAQVLQSIGYGYSRRITFSPPPGQLNWNENYFWSDSRGYGFAFQLALVSVGEKYTIYDVTHFPLGHLEIIRLQYPQEEQSHAVMDDKSVEKTARVRALARMEWFDNSEVCVVSVSTKCSPSIHIQSTDTITGTAVSVREPRSNAKVVRVVDVAISSHPGCTYTLFPGVDDKKRCITVSGAAYNDVPITYSLVGLETFEIPVIGTFVDPRILPGFSYRIRPVNSKYHLFDGRALKLVSIGNGYSKRLTFAADDKCLNNNENYFWTDSWPNGFGFELRAVHCNTTFNIYANDRHVGHACVFRVDHPQYEEKQTVVKTKHSTTVIKHVHVDITCTVVLNISETENIESNHGQVMRISGTAILKKSSADREAKLSRVENIGLASQLNLLFFEEDAHLVFTPSEEFRTA